MSGFGGITWLAGQHATLEEAVAVGAEVRAAAVAAGASLPKKALSRLYPATMQDAVSIVHARLEENKKKAQQSKQKSKSKGAPHSPSDSHFPGALQGGGDPSAFWMYIEVSAIVVLPSSPLILRMQLLFGCMQCRGPTGGPVQPLPWPARLRAAGATAAPRCALTG
jgi:hypothetical protein